MPASHNTHHGLSILVGVTLWGSIQNLFQQIRYNFITVYTPRAKTSFTIQNKVQTFYADFIGKRRAVSDLNAQKHDSDDFFGSKAKE